MVAALFLAPPSRIRLALVPPHVSILPSVSVPRDMSVRVYQADDRQVREIVPASKVRHSLFQATSIG